MTVRAVRSTASPGGASALGRGQERDFLELLLATPESGIEARLSALSAQERIILDLIARGYCNKDICRMLGIEVTTTKVHCSRIFKKLGVKNRVQAAVLQFFAILMLKRQPLSNRHSSSLAAGSLVACMGEEPDRHLVLQRETSPQALD